MHQPERGSNVGHGAGGRVHLGDAADTQIRRPERSVQPAVGSRVGNAHDFGAHFEELLERTDVSNRGDHSGGWHHRAQASLAKRQVAALRRLTWASSST